MTKVAQACFAALAFAASTVAHCAAAPVRPPARPSSYAPQEHSTNHVYGAPIDAPLVGRSRAPPPEHESTNFSTWATPRVVQDRRAKSARKAPRAKSKPGHSAVQDS